MFPLHKADVDGINIGTFCLFVVRLFIVSSFLRSSGFHWVSHGFSGDGSFSLCRLWVDFVCCFVGFVSSLGIFLIIILVQNDFFIYFKIKDFLSRYTDIIFTNFKSL